MYSIACIVQVKYETDAVLKSYILNNEVCELLESLILTVTLAVINLLFKYLIALFTDNCTQNITSSNATTIHSPNYPGSYPSNVFCEWYIDVQQGRAILEFGRFHLEGSCSYDSLKVRQYLILNYIKTEIDYDSLGGGGCKSLRVVS